MYTFINENTIIVQVHYIQYIIYYKETKQIIWMDFFKIQVRMCLEYVDSLHVMGLWFIT